MTQNVPLAYRQSGVGVRSYRTKGHLFSNPSDNLIGTLLGQCINGSCLVNGWGPIEPVYTPTNATILRDVADMTLYLRAIAYFTA